MAKKSLLKRVASILWKILLIASVALPSSFFLYFWYEVGDFGWPPSDEVLAIVLENRYVMISAVCMALAGAATCFLMTSKEGKIGILKSFLVIGMSCIIIGAPFIGWLLQIRLQLTQLQALLWGMAFAAVGIVLSFLWVRRQEKRSPEKGSGTP